MSNADIRMASATKNGQATNLTKCEVNISIESPSSATKEKDRCAIKHFSSFSCSDANVFMSCELHVCLVCLVYVFATACERRMTYTTNKYMFDYIYVDSNYKYALYFEQCTLLYPRLMHCHNLYKFCVSLLMLVYSKKESEGMSGFLTQCATSPSRVNMPYVSLCHVLNLHFRLWTVKFAMLSFCKQVFTNKHMSKADTELTNGFI